MGMNEVVVKSWFDYYLIVVKELGIEDKPERFWNCDETGVQDQFYQGPAIGDVGRPSFRITPGKKGQTTTVLASFKRRLQSPSHHLTSEAHLDFVRSVLAKRQKVEKGKERRKIAAEKRKAKSKTNPAATGARKQEKCKASAKITQKSKNANKVAADKSRKRQNQSTRPPKNSHRLISSL